MVLTQLDSRSGSQALVLPTSGSPLVDGSAHPSPAQPVREAQAADTAANHQHVKISVMHAATHIHIVAIRSYRAAIMSLSVSLTDSRDV